MSQYFYNGKNYNSFEELPHDAQVLFKDRYEVSSTFPYRAIIGVIFILGALFSVGLLIYLLINK